VYRLSAQSSDYTPTLTGYNSQRQVARGSRRNI